MILETGLVTACIALVLKLNLPTLTTDRIWEGINLDVDVQVIR